MSLPDPKELIDAKIDQWHQGLAPEGMPLHVWLGMTWKEYGTFLTKPSIYFMDIYGKA